MDALGWARMVVVGHSMGGHNAMTFAAWYPERVAALVIIDSRPAIPAERSTVMHARGRRLPRLHPSEEAAVQSFRLLPRETVADRACWLTSHAPGWRDGTADGRGASIPRPTGPASRWMPGPCCHGSPPRP